MTENTLVRTEAPRVALAESGGLQAMRAQLDEMRETLALVQEYQRSIMQEDVDFGTIPGTPKPTLYKPGAEKLLYGFRLRTEPVTLSAQEDFEKGLFAYRVERRAYRISDGAFVGSGVGACNSYEKRYRWRQGQRVCPVCNLPAIIKGKREYGGGWLCFKSKGGCGSKWPDGAEIIEKQSVDQVENPDLNDLQNTILKQADKRALVACALLVTMSSALFTQDMEDTVQRVVDHDDWDDAPEMPVAPMPQRQAIPPKAPAVAAIRPPSTAATASTTTRGSTPTPDAPAQSRPAPVEVSPLIEAAIAERAKWMAGQPVCPDPVEEAFDIITWRSDMLRVAEDWQWANDPLKLTAPRMKKLADTLIAKAGSTEAATTFLGWTFGIERMKDLKEEQVVLLERFVQGENTEAFLALFLKLFAAEETA